MANAGGATVIDLIGHPYVRLHVVKQTRKRRGHAAMLQIGRLQVENKLPQVTHGHAQCPLQPVENVMFVRSAQRVTELLYPQVGGGEHLDGVVMDVGSDPAALFFLRPNEVVKQILPVAASGLFEVQAQVKYKLGTLSLGDVPDAHDARRAPLGLDRNHVDVSRKLPQVAAAADEIKMLTGMTGNVARARAA